MSYGIMPYRVNLARLGTRFKNPISAKRLKARKACLRAAYRIGDEPNEPTYEEIIEEMINEGKATHLKFGHKYWYALQGLVADLGAFLPNGNWYPASVDLFWEDENIKLYDIDAPMSLPEPDDFPAVFVLRKENMQEEWINSLAAKMETPEQFEEFQSWIKQAKRYSQDLVMYYS